MAVPANTLQTYQVTGIRQDLMDIITTVAATETPVFSQAGSSECASTLTTWQTDALAAPDGNNAQVQGDDAPNDAQDTTTMVGNYTQILRKVIGVSRTTEAVTKAGRKMEQARLFAKRAKEIKRDAETIICSNQVAVAGSAAVAGKLAPLLGYIRTNTSIGVGGVNPVTPSPVPTTARTDGTPRAISEPLVKGVIQSMYTTGADTDGLTILVGVANKANASAFSGIATKTFYMNAAKPGVTVGAADVYVSDYGTQTFMADRFMRSRDALFLDMSLIKKAFLTPFGMEDLAKTGDSTKKMLIGEMTIKVMNEAGLGILADLS